MSHTEVVLGQENVGGTRRTIPFESLGITRRVSINGNKFYITIARYEDGTPAYLAIHIYKNGSTIDGLVKVCLKAISMLRQHGFTVKDLVKEFVDEGFEPSGQTNDPCIPTAKSIIDYSFRLIGLVSLSLKDLREIGVMLKCHECGLADTCNRRILAPHS